MITDFCWYHSSVENVLILKFSSYLIKKISSCLFKQLQEFLKICMITIQTENTSLLGMSNGFIHEKNSSEILSS